MVVCDGIGGHRRGDVASSLAMRLLEKAFQKRKDFNVKRRKTLARKNDSRH